MGDVTCQWALVHRAEGLEPSLEGGLGWAPLAKEEKPEVCANWSFYGPFLFSLVTSLKQLYKSSWVWTPNFQKAAG